jgi:hypothetical protein
MAEKGFAPGDWFVPLEELNQEPLDNIPA